MILLPSLQALSVNVRTKQDTRGSMVNKTNTKATFPRNMNVSSQYPPSVVPPSSSQLRKDQGGSRKRNVQHRHAEKIPLPEQQTDERTDGRTDSEQTHQSGNLAQSRSTTKPIENSRPRTRTSSSSIDQTDGNIESSEARERAIIQAVSHLLTNL